MILSPHFQSEEFERGSARIPADCIPIFTVLCQKILEPAREFSGAPFVITSGYRSSASNAEAHGQPDSEHMATPQWCAADFYPSSGKTVEVFDWMRNDPTLPYHQLILEKTESGAFVIHVSLNLQKPGVRSVLLGATNNAAPYTSVYHVPFAPPGTAQAEGAERG